MSKAKHQFMKVVSETEEEAIIEIYGRIGGWDWEEWKEINTIKTITEELNRIKALNSKKILVKINSLGGDCDSALTIYDALKDHNAKITTQANGYVASAATIIFMAGEVRKVSKNSLFLIHKCSSFAWGNENELQQTLDMQRQTNERMLSIYSDGCKKTKEEISELMEAFNGTGKWINAEEVQEFGFSTEIYNETSKAAAIDKNMFKAFRYPPLPEGYDFEPEEREPGFLVRLEQKIDKLFKSQNNKPITNQSLPQMKNLFPFICLSIAALSDENYDAEKGATLSDMQLKIVEASLKELSELKAAHEAHTAATQKDEGALEALQAKHDALQAIVDKLAGATPQIDGADANNSEGETFADWQKNNPYYKEISTQV